MLDNQGYGLTLVIYNIYCCSVAKMVRRTRLNITLYIHIACRV